MTNMDSAKTAIKSPAALQESRILHHIHAGASLIHNRPD